jgi:hypothetical protein
MFMSLKLGMDLAEIQAGAKLRMWPQWSCGEQKLIEAPVIDIVWQRPTQVVGLCPLQIAVNCCLSNRTTPGNLILVQTQIKT